MENKGIILSFVNRALNMNLYWIWLFILLLSLTISVGGDSPSWSDGSNSNGDSSICRVIREAKKSLLISFSQQFTTASEPACDLSRNCTNVNCSAAFSRDNVNAGLILELCEENPELTHWVNIPDQWEQPWNYTFSSKNFNGQYQRVEIIGNRNDTVQGGKKTKWFLKVRFSITYGGMSFNRDVKYISIESVLQICQKESEDTCRNTTVLNFPRMTQSQICDYQLTKFATENDENYLSSPSSSRSSRNVNTWNPHELHSQSKNLSTLWMPKSPGDSCDDKQIFGCGKGSTCAVHQNGSRTCQCLPGFKFNITSKVCVERPPSDDPSSDESVGSGSYSSAVGTIFSILLLVVIAAGIYYGVKQNYFARIRHRLPVFRCWPFRRNQPWEDNVTMVNPLGSMEDDDPPLL